MGWRSENGMLANAARRIRHTPKGEQAWDMASTPYGCGTGITNWGNPQEYSELDQDESTAVCEGSSTMDFRRLPKCCYCSGLWVWDS
ncbi:hypothetical protein O9992_12955 [Vibrio lentus]|nr:hypothetical protein [Vibrio lentus]